MSLIPLPFRPDIWRTGAFPAPWPRGAVSIYDTLVPLHHAGGTYGNVRLPDEERVRGDQAIGFMAGALDNVLGEREDDVPGQILAACLGCLRRPTAEAISDFYALLVAEGVVGSIDEVIAGVLAADVDPTRLTAFFGWMARRAPDREPVKFSLAMLGLTGRQAPTEVFRIFGGHEEFTKFAAIALGNSLGEEAAWREWWQLAKRTNGWGRIELVERIAPFGDAEFRHWLVRDGFRNNILYEYLAYIAATEGDLLGQLRGPCLAIDRPLLIGAAQILSSLVSGGPTKDMYDYPDGAEVALLWLGHVEQAPACVNFGRTVQALGTFAAREDCPWDGRSRDAVIARKKLYLRRRKLQQVTLAALRGGSEMDTWAAKSIAPAVGVDAWPLLMRRQREDPGARFWLDLMQSRDRGRITQVVALAEEQLAPEALATGPGTELGLGPRFHVHMALDFVVQELRNFPGLGWSLIRSALRSPVISNRSVAVDALAAWPKAEWPDGAVADLRAAIRAEPEANVRASMVQALTPEGSPGAGLHPR